MARSGQRNTGARNGAARNGRSQGRRNGKRHTDNEGVIPVLARVLRDVEGSVQRGAVSTGDRARFQAAGMLLREERRRVKADEETTEARRSEQLKRLEGLAQIMATTAARHVGLMALLAPDAEITAEARSWKRDLLHAAGQEAPEEAVAAAVERDGNGHERAVLPRQVVARRLSNPFMIPDFEAVGTRKVLTGRLADWELIAPLLRSFEQATPGASSCMTLPDASTRPMPPGLALMKHQAQMVAAAEQGHRTFLLADEPGLGKTAQALVAAEAVGAFPLLVVSPNVVKTNWAREAQRWTPRRPVTVVHGDGDDIDGFADIIVVNYEILDRHAGWLGRFGFRGMVVDEAHFIKNLGSQRSKHVREIADRIRARTPRPLMLALTGTPLINDIEDFRAIWQYLGWINDKAPLTDLMHALEETGLNPVDRGFYSAARNAVIQQGIVRRRKVDVAADIPARRVADLPVELDDAVGRSIRQAELELAARMVRRYHTALETRISGVTVEGIDHELVRRVATWEREDSSGPSGSGENVFTMVRRIGQAKAGLAADYTAQLSRNVGKVVFFAKHIDVLDEATKTFEERGLRVASIRGDQTAKVRQANIDAFTNDPDVSIAVCSLLAAGVGLNLQVASNLVLAELSWTDAEQTQAIDRIHRIGQSEPVTAWRIIAAGTIDTKIAELIDSKAGLAARALDGSDEEVMSSEDVQLEALVALLTQALEAEGL